MSWSKCGKSMPLCPFSFGLAAGLTCALSVLVWYCWVMCVGMPESMAGHMPPPDSVGAAAWMAGRCLIKGFIFGFVFALLYDFIACCCKAWCCKKGGNGGCGCGNPGCRCGNGNKS